jgi:hypothetical protein
MTHIPDPADDVFALLVRATVRDLARDHHVADAVIATAVQRAATDVPADLPMRLRARHWGSRRVAMLAPFAAAASVVAIAIAAMILTPGSSRSNVRVTESPATNSATATSYWIYREQRLGTTGRSVPIEIVVNDAGDSYQRPYGHTHGAYLSITALAALPHDAAGLQRALQRQGQADQRGAPEASGPARGAIATTSAAPSVSPEQLAIVGALDILQNPVADTRLRLAVVAVLAKFADVHPKPGVRDARNRLGTQFTLAAPNNVTDLLIVDPGNGALLQVATTTLGQTTTAVIEESGPIPNPPAGYPRF